MNTYVIAIPSYKRACELSQKTLQTLQNGNVRSSCIYIFVANNREYDIYKKHIPPNLYNTIIIGKKGIRNQRIFISKYFPEGQYIVSIDDDVEEISKLRKDTLVKIGNIDKLFQSMFLHLEKEKLYIWGTYPVRNPFFMKQEKTTSLKFIIGVLHGYINRHDNQLYPSIHSEGKEDYDTSIRFYKMDGGVLRYNNINAKTKFNAPGGLGVNRYQMNKKAADYLYKTYSNIVTVFKRSSNGMYEVRLKSLPRFSPSSLL